MPEALPVAGLEHVSIVVRDIEAAIPAHAELYGIRSWAVHEVDSEHAEAFVIDGSPTTRSAYRVARSTDDTVPIPIRLVQPLHSDSIYARRLGSVGEGIHEITVSAASGLSIEDIRHRFAGSGVGIAQEVIASDGDHHVVFDTFDALGGVGIAVGSDASDDLDHWPTEREPSWIEPLEVFGVGHLGVVVHDTLRRVERYSELLGAADWMMVDWHPAPHRLIDPHYQGQSVDHAFFCGLCMPWRGFGWEIIQPKWGPQDYREGFLDLRGEGVHHMLVMRTGATEWDHIVERLQQKEVAVAMGGGLLSGRGAYHYLDTRDLLGGYVLEVATIDDDLVDRPADMPEFVPDYVLQLAEEQE